MVSMQVWGDAAPVCTFHGSGEAKLPPSPAMRFAVPCASIHCTSQGKQQYWYSCQQLPPFSIWAHLLLFRSVLVQRKKSPLRSIGLPPSSEVSELLESAAVIAAGCDAAGACRNVWQASVMQSTVGSCSGLCIGSAAGSNQGSLQQGAMHQKLEVSGAEQTVMTASLSEIKAAACPA